jgi:hypothetical protein
LAEINKELNAKEEEEKKNQESKPYNRKSIMVRRASSAEFKKVDLNLLRK